MISSDFAMYNRYSAPPSILQKIGRSSHFDMDHSPATAICSMWSLTRPRNLRKALIPDHFRAFRLFTSFSIQRFGTLLTPLRPTRGNEFPVVKR